MNRRLARARARLWVGEGGEVRLNIMEPYHLGYRPVRGEVLYGHQKMKGGELFVTNKAFAVQGTTNYRRGWGSIGEIEYSLNGYELHPRNGRSKFFAWKRFEPEMAVLIDILLARESTTDIVEDA